MLRAITEFIVMMVAFAVLRAIISAVTKAAGGGGGARPAQRAAPPRDVTPGGELRRDPVCGTFVPMIGSPHKSVNGITQYFCSQTCLDRFRPA